MKENKIVKRMTSEEVLLDLVTHLLDINEWYIVSTDLEDDEEEEWFNTKCNHPIINIIDTTSKLEINDVYDVIENVYGDYIKSYSTSINNYLITIRIKWDRNNVIFK